MSKYKIEITEPAENDLYEIGRYIAVELLEPVIAKNMVEKIAQVILTLEEIPFRNALVLDKRHAFQGFRKILVENYIVLYIVEEENETVTIVRILYNRRDWAKLI